MIYNESTIVGVGGLFYLFIQPIESSSRSYMLGWVGIAVIMVALCINIFYLLYVQIKQWVNIIRKLCRGEGFSNSGTPNDGKVGYNFTKGIEKAYEDRIQRRRLSTTNTSGIEMNREVHS